MDTERPRTLGQHLKAHRKHQKWSFHTAGERLGISGPMVSMIEKGKRDVTPRIASKIATMIGMEEEIALMMAGHMPWIPSVELAQQVAKMFVGSSELRSAQSIPDAP